MPLWTDEYIADTSHLSDAEHGRYLLMLQHMWRSPGRRFPNDDEWLARKFNRTVDAVREQLRPLIGEFFKTDGNWIFHGRMEREWTKVSAGRQKQSVRSKARWEKEKSASRGNATDALHEIPAGESDPAKPLSENGNDLSPGNAIRASADAPARGVDSNTLAADSTVPTDSAIQEEKKERIPDPELPIDPPAKPPESPKAKPPRAAPVRKEYPEAFERLWVIYPRREEDTKADCLKYWLRVKAEADIPSILAAANLWRSVQGPNPYRFGLRRWLRDRAYLHDPPTYQPNGYGNGSGHDAFAKAAASLMRDDPPPPNDEADYGEYLELEGTCDRLPD